VNHYSEVTAEVDGSRGGRTTAAFFDFDGTLIFGFSVASFVQRRLLSGDMPPREMFRQFMAAWQYGLGMADFEDVLVHSARGLRGSAATALEEAAREVYEKDLSGNIYPESRALIAAHRAKGHTIVVVSSATQYQVQHVAAELGIDHVLCTELEVDDGMLTGEIIPPVCYGEGKLEAARRFADEHGISLDRSFFYTDGGEDIPLLEAVKYPRPLNPDRKLTSKSEREGWPVQRFASRGLPGVSDVIRTSLVYGSLVGSFMAGMPAWLLNRSKQDLINVAVPVWGDFGSAVAGLDIEVEGEEHLWSHRPAVFIFNHQSQTDALILSRLLRRDFTGVAKKEMKSNPLLGTILDAMGTVFIDRDNHDAAIEALQPAVDSLKKGTSFAIAPEGRRSRGYKLGRFKMGAFHIAMQAGVPVVPIVIANSSDSMPRSGVFIRPAKIDVKVLPPVTTENWTVDNIHQHVDEIRRLYLRELGQSRRENVKLRRLK
jgi:putative phosphoserine phosphatase / 1-acylglycerol-3-phosphate O-acyltransferase